MIAKNSCFDADQDEKTLANRFKNEILYKKLFYGCSICFLN